jgi:hypothetical protein
MFRMKSITRSSRTCVVRSTLVRELYESESTGHYTIGRTLEQNKDMVRLKWTALTLLFFDNHGAARVYAFVFVLHLER